MCQDRTDRFKMSWATLPHTDAAGRPRAVASAATSSVAKVADKMRHYFVGLGLGEVVIEMKGVHISTSKPRAQSAADLRCQACGGVRSEGRRPMSTSQSASALTAKALLPKPTAVASAASGRKDAGSQAAAVLTAKAILPKPRAVASAASLLVAKVADQMQHHRLGEVAVEMKSVNTSTCKPPEHPGTSLADRAGACLWHFSPSG